MGKVGGCVGREDEDEEYDDPTILRSLFLLVVVVVVVVLSLFFPTSRCSGGWIVLGQECSCVTTGGISVFSIYLERSVSAKTTCCGSGICGSCFGQLQGCIVDFKIYLLKSGYGIGFGSGDGSSTELGEGDDIH